MNKYILFVLLYSIHCIRNIHAIIQAADQETREKIQLKFTTTVQSEATVLTGFSKLDS